MDIPAQQVAQPATHLEAFTFGDPEPVLSRRALLGLDHIECWRTGKWYEPPISLEGLSRSQHASPHHGSALRFKMNLLAESFIPHPKLSRPTFRGLALDYLVLGNSYPEAVQNMRGRLLRIDRPLAKYVRRGVDMETYYFIKPGSFGVTGGEHEFEAGSIVHLQEPDIDQEVYGCPEYISALQSAFLNEAATIFRRRYYQNGSHAGFILYSSDEQLSDKDVDALRKALRDAKGPGNFRNLFLHAPKGKKDGLQLIPVGEVAAKDEFLGIKNTSRDDILAAHRVPPQLLGVVPVNAGGFGDVAKASDVFHRLEIRPLQSRFLELNDALGEEVVAFEPYEPLSAKAGAANDAGGRERPAA